MLEAGELAARGCPGLYVRPDFVKSTKHMTFDNAFGKVTKINCRGPFGLYNILVFLELQVLLIKGLGY